MPKANEDTNGMFAPQEESRTAIDYIEEMERVRKLGAMPIRLNDYPELYDKQRAFVHSPHGSHELIVGLHGAGKSFLFQSNKFPSCYYCSPDTAIHFQRDLYNSKDQGSANNESSSKDRHTVADECHRLLKAEGGLKAIKQATESTETKTVILGSRSIQQIDDEGNPIVEFGPSGGEYAVMVPKRFQIRSRVMLISNFIPENVFAQEGMSFFSRFEIYYFVPSFEQIHEMVGKWFDAIKHRDVYEFMERQIADNNIRLLDMRLYTTLMRWKLRGEDWKSNFERGNSGKNPTERIWMEVYKEGKDQPGKSTKIWERLWVEKTAVLPNGPFSIAYFWKLKKAFDAGHEKK